MARLENEAAYLDGLRVSVAGLLARSVSLLGIDPGEGDYEVDADTGKTVTLAPSFDQALELLRADAERVTSGKADPT